MCSFAALDACLTLDVTVCFDCVGLVVLFFMFTTGFVIDTDFALT
jgi:hypothetical protein